MTLEDTLSKLKELGNEKVRAQNAKQGAGDNQYGVRLGELRKLAKKIKKDHELALALWETGNIDARFLAILIIDIKKLTADQMVQMVQSITFVRVADWFNSYIARTHPDKETLRQNWMTADHPMAARSGWSLTTERIGKNPEGLNLSSLLDRIEQEMGNAAPETQWTMNFALVEIGTCSIDHRKRAIAIGERLGLYRDYPVSKGCTSPFAPIAIEEMVSRRG